jgi:hypothetical protein
MKKFLLLSLSLLVFLVACEPVVIEDSVNEQPQPVEEVQISPEEEEEEALLEAVFVEIGEARVKFDSTERIPKEVAFSKPLTDEEVAEQGMVYQVELQHWPTCLGTQIVNEYVMPFEGNDPYNYIVISFERELNEDLQAQFDALISDEDDGCLYIQESEENQAEIDTLIQNYKDTYEEEDLNRIRGMLEAIKEAYDGLVQA